MRQEYAMKISTERRLIFALLLSSLIPLTGLGLLSAFAVHSLRMKVTGNGSITTIFLTSQQLISLTGKIENTILLLTLVAILCVTTAALVVIGRIVGPYRRLGEKARILSGSPPNSLQFHNNIDNIAKTFDSLTLKAESREEQLRTTEKRIKEFIDMSPDGIAVIGWSGDIFHINDALCRMLRRSREELSKLHAQDLFSNPDDRIMLLARLRKNGLLKNYEVELLRGDGGSFPSLLTLRQSTCAGIECIDVIARDISELVEGQKKKRSDTESLFRLYGELNRAHRALKKAYEESEEKVKAKTKELRTAYEALKASDRVKTDFLMQMSHELRTPLNCIIGYSEALVHGFDGPVTETQAASLRRIAKSGNRLLRMIENLLDISRIASGGMDFSFSRVCMKSVIEDIFHQANNLVRNIPISLELSMEDTLPHAWADQDRVSQVLFNLVENAIKFTKQGRIIIEARHSSRRFLEVKISDTGPGIEEKHADFIFNKFVKTGGNNKSGVGLGLAISKEIVTSMGGKIWLDRNNREGCTFAFTLPAAQTVEQIALPWN